MIAGIGNVFRAEALFACGQHPSRPAASLPRAEFDRLWATVRAMMRHGVTDGRIVTVAPPAGRSRTEVPEDEARYVYKQACCRRCGAPVASWSWAGAPPMPARSSSRRPDADLPALSGLHGLRARARQQAPGQATGRGPADRAGAAGAGVRLAPPSGRADVEGLSGGARPLRPRGLSRVAGPRLRRHLRPRSSPTSVNSASTRSAARRRRRPPGLCQRGWATRLCRSLSRPCSVRTPSSTGRGSGRPRRPAVHVCESVPSSRSRPNGAVSPPPPPSRGARRRSEEEARKRGRA